LLAHFVAAFTYGTVAYFLLLAALLSLGSSSFVILASVGLIGAVLVLATVASFCIVRELSGLLGTTTLLGASLGIIVPMFVLESRLGYGLSEIFIPLVMLQVVNLALNIGAFLGLRRWGDARL
jgi:hypothetical protein